MEKPNDEILENGVSEQNHNAGKLCETLYISESEKGRGIRGNRVENVSESSDITEQINTFLECNGDISELDIGDIGAMDEILDSFENTSDESLLSSFTQANENAEAKLGDVEKTANSEEESVIVLDPKELDPNQPSTSKMEISNDSEGDDSDEEEDASQAKNLRTMEPHEERLVLEKLNKIDSLNPTAKRLRRKLIVNHRKRQCGLPVFDLDNVFRTSLESVSHYVLQEGECAPVFKPSFENTEQKPELVVTKPRKASLVKHERVLDRFMMQPVSQKPVKQVSFLGRLIGCNPRSVNRAITSPYTSRVLKPFIRRDFEATPLKLKLLREICTWFRQRYPGHELPPVEFGSIDYCYVQPHHIPGVNALCREFFWPGIDLSECLQYPDFTCVVLYKKLIIGCAFMVPDVKYNEAYISFVLVHPDWRRAGIGSFMIYHLIQTCLGKDVTLHVSANNPAMLLYQKFGFKPERFVVGFYDRYYPSEGLDSKHAFFLRLQR